MSHAAVGRTAGRRRGWARVVAAVAALSLVVVACGAEQESVAGDGADEDSPGEEEAADSGEVFELRFANFLGPQAAQILAMRWWAEQVEERTDGRVTVEFFDGGSLLAAGDTLPGIGDGRAEMGHVAHFYHPGELPLSTVSELPFMVANPQVQARVFNQLYRDSEEFRGEWEAMGVHVLHFNPSGVVILGSEDPIVTPEDLQGRQVRAVGYAARALDAVGANPQALEAPEIYESMQRGLIDSYSSFPFEVITAFQLQEVAPYVADPGLGNYLLTAAPISLSMWEAMPDDIRQILTEVSEELLDDAVWDIYADVEDAVCDAIVEAGGEVTVFTDDDVSAWQDQLGPEFLDEWLDNVATDRGSAEQFLDDYRTALDVHSEDADFDSGVRRCAGL